MNGAARRAARIRRSRPLAALAHALIISRAPEKEKGRPFPSGPAGEKRISVVRERLLAAAALRLATTTLARLTHLALPLDAGLLVETAPLDLLQDAFLRHLLLQDLHRLLKAIANFDFQRPAEQVVHFLRL